MKPYYTYLLTNKGRTVLYCGVTNNLQRRLLEHQAGNSKFTSRYDVHHLVWYAEFNRPIEAIVMEKRVKNMTRLEKNKLIESINPEWRFLELN